MTSGYPAKIVVAASILALASVATAAAQSYPTKPIKIVVSTVAGTTPDVIARLVAEQLSARLGQRVFIDNRPGGVHSIALNTVTAAEPDGYTLLLGATGSLTINPALRHGLGAEPAKTLAPVALLATTPNVMVVSSEVPVKTFAEFVAYSRANPGRLSYGAGPATPPHLLAEYIRIRSGANLAFVPYRGAAQALPDLFGGHIQIVAEGPGVISPYIQQRRVTPLVVTSAERLPELPDVPTLAEVGIEGYPSQTWMGLMAPPNTPDAVISALNAAANDVLKSTEVKTSLAKLGFTPQSSSPQDFAALIAADREKWAAVAKAANIAME